MKIEVTQDDIDNGTRGNGHGCAIARAIKRIVGQESYVRVGGFHTVINNKHFSTPTVAREFIQKFDLSPKSIVSPFVFMLEENQVGKEFAPRDYMYAPIKPDFNKVYSTYNAI